MGNDKFIIPANFTLLQSLQLLYSIVASQCENYEKQAANLELNINDLVKLYRLFDNLLQYMNDGLSRIEKSYKLQGGLRENTSNDKDLKRKFEDLQLLGQDIRLSRRECNNRIGVLENIRNNQSIFGKFRSRSTKRCKPKFEDEKQENTAIEAAENVRRERRDKELRKLEKEKQRQLELDAQKEKEIELFLKQQLEAEYLEKESKRDAITASKRKSMPERKAVGSPTLPQQSTFTSRRPDRHSMYVNGGSIQRTTGKSSEESGLRPAASVARSSSTGGGSGAPKKRYEYVKPVIRRQPIRSPRATSRVASPEIVGTDGFKPVVRRERNSNSLRRNGTPQSPPMSSPPLVAAGREKFGTDSSDEDASDDKSDSSIDNYMGSSVNGVDPIACRQIMKEIVIQDEEVRWDDIAGLRNAKNSLKETVVYPFLRPDLFKGLREPIRGMLLFGPPGTGKTMIAKAVATESKSTFFSISASSLLSKYMGESEKLVRALFYMAKKMAPSIIFIDEIDSLLTARSDNENESSRRVKTELLIQWSSLSSSTGNDVNADTRVLVLAATNLPWAIDEAARRRFSRRLYIPLPEFETRLHHLKKLMSKQNNHLSEIDFEVIAEMTEGFSGSDITALAKEAAMEPIRDLGDRLVDAEFSKIRPVTVKDFEKAMLTVKMSVSPASLQQYQDWAAGFGSTGA
ncbi:ZYRO0D03938p [Zygosaccharomyces rouxii]|uniref:ZYRO0D03938p n=1 Tax=Zygosaccharomyces rouxii (strain ATCC 2623 / CBS 732 / NBRC 1130 / NCYC 568 / NRRL Y-229) TaxID=559307 RepID=C5DV52_ZYGRC|nr:uncharacterized protein ZYRO0D03938g [Zygosaccharomyces rouxii]KAH9200584.1 P-loop containing nucleoside triphosphate hydrolase protein [Zygosaccharomyces rouxii]CAR27671.1 ZYRO0D03938p [Zygosaccharomyces rouxii]